MKNVFLLFFVLLISVPAAGQLTNESDSITVEVTKDLKKRDKAMLLSFIFPSAGHAYADNWFKGLGFAVVRVGCTYVAIYSLYRELRYSFSTNENHSENRNVFYATLVTGLVFTIWEIIDAGLEVDRYNERITKKLNGNKIDFGLVKMYSGAGVEMRLNF